MIIKKVISGGQTGADQAGIEVARDFGIETGGWAPKEWKTAEGNMERLLKPYGLIEHSGGYKPRTWANVRDSDGTMRLAIQFKSPGEVCTLNAIKHYKKPYFDVFLPEPEDPTVVVKWIAENNIKVLNIAGNRQYKEVDIFDMVYQYLYKVFIRLRYI